MIVAGEIHPTVTQFIKPEQSLTAACYSLLKERVCWLIKTHRVVYSIVLEGGSRAVSRLGAGP